MLALAMLALGVVALTAGARAEAIPVRTIVLSTDASGRPADGPSGGPVISATGRVVAFESDATNLLEDADPNGPVRDIYTVDRQTKEKTLVSMAPGRASANGPSFAPALSSDGSTIAFASEAKNFVPGDPNDVRDVFVRVQGAAVQLVSVADGGGFADNASSQPDVSGDGRLVVFTSEASNLVGGDANALPDVFVRDLMTGVTRMVSRGGAGSSSAPAISADGRFVCFFSTDPALVEGDTNGVGDVFIRKIVAGGFGPITRVSISSTEREQNLAVEEPFTQVSDLSRDGRFVTFDSDATNLVVRDRNSDTDVFVRDRTQGVTRRVSVSSADREGDNDSFNPTITANGRFVAFQSFAESLASVSGPREDVFVRDRRLATTSVISVGAAGQARGEERVRQNLQRPMVSDSGSTAVFTSTAGNLLTGTEGDRVPATDDNGALDVFVRRMSRPQITRASIRAARRGRWPVMTLRADDPRATRFLCRLDRRIQFECKAGTRALVGVRRGRHVMTVRAGGTGMLYSSAARRLPFSVGG